jgi:pSer/pThr/pTyr-binding forkhead associated (FHA) protein
MGERSANVIGGDAEATVWVDSSTVSRCHAVIFVSPGGAPLEDLGEVTNVTSMGTLVSDEDRDHP